MWRDIVPGLSTARVMEEERTRAILNTFRRIPVAVQNVPNVSLYEIHPYFHVKILRTEGDVDTRRPITFPRDYTVVHHEVSGEHRAAVYITRQITGVRWTDIDGFESIVHDLFVIHHHTESHLLFICASRRTDSLYQHIAGQFAVDDLPAPRGLPGKMLNGHWFGSAEDQGNEITIGLSITSKVWSNASGQIPQLVEWCDALATKLNSDRMPTTSSGLDHLPMGDEATEIPDGIAYADWHQSAYRTPMGIRYSGPEGEHFRGQLLDLDLLIEYDRCDKNQIGVLLQGDLLEYRAVFRLHHPSGVYFEPDPANQTEIFLDTASEKKRLLDYLNEKPLIFYTPDFVMLEGRTLYPASVDKLVPFDRQRLEAHDWPALGVDIRREFGQPSDAGRSIHDFLADKLQQLPVSIIFYDHGTGELADYVTITESDGEIRVTLYHCKGTKKDPGERVEDIYEVCGQAVKSTNWADRKRLFKKMKHRFDTRKGKSAFVRGNLETAQSLLIEHNNARFILEVAVVQPGLSAGSFTEKGGALFAATDDFVVQGRCARLRVICSE